MMNPAVYFAPTEPCNYAPHHDKSKDKATARATAKAGRHTVQVLPSGCRLLQMLRCVAAPPGRNAAVEVVTCFS